MKNLSVYSLIELMKGNFTIVFFFIFFLFLFALKPAQAAYFEFDQTAINVNAGETFTVKVNINTEEEEVNSSDIYLNFNSSLIEAQQITAGSFFPTVTNNISAGMVYIAAMVDDPASSKTGSGEVATITFKALANGSGEISFDCDNSKIVKNDINATNILVCSKNNKTTLTIGNGGASTTSSTLPTSTPTVSSLPRSGVFDNLKNIGISGLILFSFGILGKILLKY